MLCGMWTSVQVRSKTTPTWHGTDSATCGYGLLLNWAARELSVEDVQRQRGFLVMQQDWGPNECRSSGWYMQVGGCRIRRAPFFFGPHYIGEVCVTEGYVGMIQPSEKDLLMACQSVELRASHWRAEEDEGGTAAPRQW